VSATDDLAVARDRRRRRLTRGLGAAAAAVAVIAAGASVTAIVRSGGGNNTGTSAAGSSASTTSGGAGTAGRSGQLAPDAAPEGGTAVPGDASVAVPSYDRDSLRRALPSIVRAAPLGQVGGAGDTGPAGAMADAARRTACAGSIRGTRGSLRAVQRISYHNQPAYVLVYDDNGQLTGYVVADGCGTAAALPAVLLDTVS
jgi:hypothetical protein